MKDANIETPQPADSQNQAESKPVATEHSEEPIGPGIQSKTDRAITLKDALDVFGKLIFGLAGLCYVLGVVVVTIHLRQYGVNSLDLSQLHYVTAGVWVVLPIACITTFIIFAIFLAASQTDENQRSRSWSDRIYTAFSAVSVLIFIILFFWPKIGIEFSWKSVVWIPIIGSFATLMIFVGGLSLRKLTRTTTVKGALPFIVTPILGLGLFAAYVLLFAQYTYPSIPWATGGGRASSVRLFITPESMPYLQGLKVALATKQQNGMVETDSIKLLLTTEKQLVVINADGKAVSLPAETVKGISYEK